MVKLRSEICGVDDRQSSPALNEHGRWKGTTCERAKLGDRLAVTGDREGLASSHAIEDITAAVPKFPNRNLAHGRIVSPVRLETAVSRSVCLRKQVIFIQQLTTSFCQRAIVILAKPLVINGLAIPECRENSR